MLSAGGNSSANRLGQFTDRLALFFCDAGVVSFALIAAVIT